MGEKAQNCYFLMRKALVTSLTISGDLFTLAMELYLNFRHVFRHLLIVVAF